MILAQITGTIVATQKIDDLHGLKLLVAQPLSPEGHPSGASMVAVDTVQAGKGDAVLIIDEGGSAGIVLDKSSPAIRTIVAAIVDKIDMIGEETK